MLRVACWLNTSAHRKVNNCENDVTLTPTDNGPTIVKGPFRIVDVEGHEIPTTGSAVALCRCGASSQKPFCDGTHVTIGFQSTVRAVQQAPA